ncbi:MAG: hypothetical protein ABW133_12405 [Polyangiaceae bacterium]
MPLKLEKLTLATRLSPDECRARLVRTTSHFLDFLRPFAGSRRSPAEPAVRIEIPLAEQPVRGVVLERAFYLGQEATTRAWLRTWISGQIRRVEQKTVIEVSIGPNRVAGFFLTLLAALLGVGATIATVLAFTSPFETWFSAALSWAVVGTFIAVFFVFPASDHAGERAFLLDYLQRTLEAQEQRKRLSSTP